MFKNDSVYQLVSQEDLPTIYFIKPHPPPWIAWLNWLRASMIILPTVLFISLLSYAIVKFSNLERNCTLLIERDCYYEFISEKKDQLVSEIGMQTLIIALITTLSLKQIFFYKNLSYVSISLYFITLYYFERPQSMYNFSHFYTVMSLGLIIFQAIAIYLLLTIIQVVRRRMILIIPFKILVVLLYYGYDQMRNSYPCSDWMYGINGLKAESNVTVNNQTMNFCQLKVPKSCEDRWISSFLDLSYMFYDCTTVPYTEMERHKQIWKDQLNITYDPNYLVLPSIQNFTNKQRDPKSLQKNVIKNTLPINDSEHLQTSEIYLDFTQMKYIINMTKDQALCDKRKEQREQIMKEFQKNGRKMPKNVVLIFIDTLNRVGAARKLPKTMKWMEVQAQKKKFKLFQSLKYQALWIGTYHNALAFTYGVSANPKNLDYHSYFSNSNQYFQKQNFETNETFQYLTKLEHFVHGAKDSGFITSHTTSYCSLNSVDVLDLTMPMFNYEAFDHEGIQWSCDPNYQVYVEGASMSTVRYGKRLGPYSIFRRCLYGQELFSLQSEYQRQFFNLYKDQPKFMHLELMESHEGSQQVITYTDDDILQLLESFEDENQMDDSVFILFSDHGIHLSLLYDKLNPQLYDLSGASPLFMMLLDESLLNEDDAEILSLNQQKMLTPYELFYTIKYLTNPDADGFFKNNSVLSTSIDAGRSCKDIPIQSGTPCICK